MSISKNDILLAHQRIESYIHRTPILTNNTINQLAQCEIYFKCENFQKIGAFKIRGALNAALSLPTDQLKNGLATHSSGNHAQAIAYTAKILNTKAFIVMPNNSPNVKVNAVKDYGAEIIFCEPNQIARETTLNEVVKKTNAAFIHPYDDYRVITGQATCAKELIEDTEKLDTLVAPVGGGGLFSGTCMSTTFFSPNTTLYGAEPEGANDAYLSFRAGKIQKAPNVNTIADGLLTTLSEKTFDIISTYSKDILLVTDNEIKQAMQLIYERMKIVIEPSCSVPLAAILKNKELFKDKRIGVILSGGNTDLKKINEWFE